VGGKIEGKKVVSLPKRVSWAGRPCFAIGVSDGCSILHDEEHRGVVFLARWVIGRHVPEESVGLRRCWGKGWVAQMLGERLGCADAGGKVGLRRCWGKEKHDKDRDVCTDNAV
jgi:hypothetical protein